MTKVSLSEAKFLRAGAFAVWRYPRLLSIALFALLGSLVVGLGYSYAGVVGAVAAGLLSATSGIWLWRFHYLALTANEIVVGRTFWAWTVDLSEITELDPHRYGIYVGTESGRLLNVGPLQQADIFVWLRIRSRARWVCDQIKRQAERKGNLAIHVDDGRPLHDIRHRKDVIPP